MAHKRTGGIVGGKGALREAEWADKDGCPMDNPNEEMKDCAGCVWFKETEE